MASIEDMTDEEILASSMPGDRGYVMPELRDPILRGRESDDQALMSSIQAEPSYKIGTPDVAPITDDEATANEIARRDLAKSIGERTDPDLMDVASEVAAEFPSRVSRGAKQVYQGLDALATDILMFPVKYARNPLGEGAKIEQAAVDLAKGVASGDPESIRNAADIASMKDPSGVSDLTSAAASARLAYVEPEKRSSHLVDVGISSLAAAIPLVGSGMVKQVLRGAPDPKTTAQLFPETIETTDGFKFYKVKTEDGFEYRDSLDPDAYDMSLKPEDIREMFKMSGDMPIPEDLSIALRAMDKDVSLAMDATPPTPVFESVLEKAVNGLKQDKIGVDQVESQLQSIARKQGAGISASEIDATRLRDFLKNAKAAGKKSVSKDELIEHLNANKVQIEEVRLGGIGEPEDAYLFERISEDVEFSHQDLEGDVREFLTELEGMQLNRLAETGLYDVIPGRRQSLGGYSKSELYHLVKHEPLELQRTLLGTFQISVRELTEITDSILSKYAGGPNTNHTELSRTSIIAKPSFSSYEDMTERQLIEMIQWNDRSAETAFMQKEDLVEMAKSYDDLPTNDRFSELGQDTLLEIWNAERAKSLNTVLEPKDAVIFDDIYMDLTADGAFGVQANDLLNGENVQNTRNGLARLIQKYERMSGGREQLNLVNDLRKLDMHFAAMQQPGDLVDQQALVNRFIYENPKMRQHLRLTKELQEASKGMEVLPTKWAEYTMPGGRNYQEILLTVPSKVSEDFYSWHKNQLNKSAGNTEKWKQSNYDLLPPEQQSTARLYYKQDTGKKALEFEVFDRSHHGNVDNVMTHIRTTDRVDSQGRKILFIEEIQSDWHQQARKQGYKVPPGRSLIPENVEQISIKLDEAQAAVDNLPEIKFDYENWVTVTNHLAPRLDSSFNPLPRPTGFRTKNDRNEFYDQYVIYGSDWLEGIKNTENYQSMSPRRQKMVEEFAEYNDARAAQLPVRNALRETQDQFLKVVQPHAIATYKENPSFYYTKQSFSGPPVLSGSTFLENLLRTKTFRQERALPDAPFKKTEEWVGLAVKRIMREAADKGYDGVAFTRGADIHAIAGGKREGQIYFYDTLLPSVVKRQTKAKVSKTTIGIPDNPDYYPEGEDIIPQEFNFIELTPEVKERSRKPQKLFEVAIGVGAGGAAVRSLKDEEVSDGDGT